MGKKSKRNRANKGAAKKVVNATAVTTVPEPKASAASNATHPSHPALAPRHAANDPADAVRDTTRPTTMTPLHVQPWSEDEAGSPWLKYDARLLGDAERKANRDSDGDMAPLGYLTDFYPDSGDMYEMHSAEGGPLDTLEDDIEEYLQRGEHLLRGCYSFGTLSEDWAAWAFALALHPTRLAAVPDEYDKDVKLHLNVLRRMQNDSAARVGQSLSFANRAGLNCLRMQMAMACDVFARLSLPLPPHLDLTEAEGSQDYGSHLFTWFEKVGSHYGGRILHIVQLVKKNVPRDAVQEEEMPAIVEPIFRGPFISMNDDVRQAILRDDWMKEDWDSSTDRNLTGNDLYTGEEEDGGWLEDLLAQGVRPWDADAADVLAVLNGGL